MMQSTNEKSKQVLALRSINTLLTVKFGYTESTLMEWWTGDSIRFQPTPLIYAKDNNLGLKDILEYLSGN